MKTEFLKGLGLNDDQINAVMAENGKDIKKFQDESAKLTKEKEKLDTKVANLESELETTNQTLADANSQIEKFKEMDVEAIKAGAEDWKNKYETAQSDLKKQKEQFEADMKQKEYDHAVNDYFNGFKFVDDVVKDTVINAFKEKKFPLDDGKFLGADDYMKDYQEQHKALFVDESTQEKTTMPQIVKGADQQQLPGKSGFNFNFVGVRPHETQK